MTRKLALALLLIAGSLPVQADYVIGTCTIRVPTPPATNCYYADLTSANLSSTSLTNADLRYTKLAGANLAGTNLTGAKLSGVTSGGIVGAPAALPAGWQLVNG